MSVNYRIEDLFVSVESSFCGMISALSLARHLNVFGNHYVLPNLEDFKLSADSDYRILVEYQINALGKRRLERFSIAAGLRGVFASMYEMLEHNNQFKKTVKHLLKETFEPFFSLIKFLRHIYSHDITWAATGDIVLKRPDFASFVKRQRKNKVDKILFDFSYRDKLPEIGGPIGYKIHISFSITDLKVGKNLSSIISRFNQIILAELCFNLCTYLSQQEKN